MVENIIGVDDGRIEEVILVQLANGQLLVGQKCEYENPEPDTVYVRRPMALMMSMDGTGRAQCGLAKFNPFAAVERKVYGIPKSAVLFVEPEANIGPKDIVNAYKTAVSGIAIATGRDVSALKL